MKLQDVKSQATLKAGVYRIRNISNGRAYIGSSVCVRRRLVEHLTCLVEGKHPNPHMQRAWIKYGPEAFEFDVLVSSGSGAFWLHKEGGGGLVGRLMSQGVPVDDLLLAEDFFLERLDFSQAYNISRKANSVMTGRKHTEETRRKMSLAHKGKKKSAQHIAAMRAVRKTPRKPPTDEQRKAASERLSQAVVLWQNGFCMYAKRFVEAAALLGVKQACISCAARDSGSVKGFFVLQVIPRKYKPRKRPEKKRVST